MMLIDAIEGNNPIPESIDFCGVELSYCPPERRDRPQDKITIDASTGGVWNATAFEAQMFLSDLSRFLGYIDLLP